jgi:hypothetical protein
MSGQYHTGSAPAPALKFTVGRFSLILIISIVHLNSSEKCTNVIKVLSFSSDGLIEKSGV